MLDVAGSAERELAAGETGNLALAAERQAPGGAMVFGAGAVMNGHVRFVTTQTNAGPLLAEFEMRRDGNMIRIIDQDGSVYAGESRTSAPQDSFAVGGVLNKSELVGGGGGGGGAAAMTNPISTSSGTTAALDTQWFHVIGTNRSLGKRVEFTGMLTESASPPATVAPVTRSVAPSQPARSSPSGVQNARVPLMRIEGKARVEDQGELDVEARTRP
jgi:hypothetical protein